MQQPTLTVEQYMTKDPVIIDGGLNLVDTYTRMFQYDVRHLPVYSGGHLVGIISDRDIGHTLATRMLDPQKTTVESICTPNPYVVAPEAPLDQVVQTMCENKLGAALVMREGKLLGIFTVIDAQQCLLAQLRRAA